MAIMGKDAKLDPVWDNMDRCLTPLICQYWTFADLRQDIGTLLIYFILPWDATVTNTSRVNFLCVVLMEPMSARK
jgi:hypothetical protein